MSETNQRTLRNLLQIKDHALDAKVNLLADEKIDEAAALSEKILELDERINQLRSHILDDWLAKEDNLYSKVEGLNAEVQAAVDEIKANIDTAQKIVKLSGYLDDAITIAAKVLI